jgi:hypothetical protein
VKLPRPVQFGIPSLVSADRLAAAGLTALGTE